MDKRRTSRLQSLPGVGVKTAADLESIGIRSPAQLSAKNPEQLYRRLRVLHGGKLDRCMLYVLRCAVYCSSHPNAGNRQRKWWNWKNRQRKK